MTQKPKTILLADDDAGILTVLTRAIKQRGYQVLASENLSDVDAWVTQGLGDAVVTDITMPRGNGLEGLQRWHAKRPELPVIVMSAHNTLLNAAKARDLGAVTFLPKPFDLEELLEALEYATSAQQPSTPDHESESAVRISDDLVLVGHSAPMKQLFATLAKLIGNDLTVFITGESGTGKELVARALHQLSPRKAQPFVALNMAAIPRELVESSLFGHERGAFTGAHQKQIGAFEQAAGGTLFLDEIGDMPMEAQTRLLRVLQEQEVTPIGAARAIKTNVRIVVATHRDVKALVAAGKFREDLYFRLHVVPVSLPSLREHTSDIPALVAHFMATAKLRGLAPKQLDDTALRLLMEHAWPGNVRELEHVVYRLCALNTQAIIHANDVAKLLGSSVVKFEAATASNENSNHGLPVAIEPFLDKQLRLHFAAQPGGIPAAGLYDRLLALLERPLITQTLRATGGNQIKAADILGLNRNTLRKKMRELGIDAKSLMQKDAA